MAGLIATKVGMSRLYRENGESVPVTFLKVEPNIVVRTNTKEKDGYNAVVLGIGKKLWKSRKGKENVRYAHQKEWQVESLDGFETGKEIKADLLAVDAMVTVSGVSKGKGFQGVMRRHHFGGGPASHGSHFKREPGSIGMRTQPGRVLKGHPMAGHMGHDKVTVRNRAVVAVDMEHGVVAIKGPVPGPAGSRVYLTLEAAPEPAKK
jgi:large subunit ribosomal protein L3